MIYTVTTSPSIDLVMKLQGQLEPGTTHRVKSEELRPGGKGINISIMLHNLGINSTAFGFVAGFSGDELMRMTAATGVKTGFIRVRKGRTRINVRLKGDNHQRTGINGIGPEISPDDVQYLIRKISALTSDDFLVLAGMVPPSLPQDIYASFFESFKEQSKPKVIVDAPADQLKYVLKYHPFLIKPNLKELSDYLSLDLKDSASVLEACKHLQGEGARNIMVSLGRKGAIFMDDQGNSRRIPAPGGSRVDKTGAGDSMIAGFLADYITTQSLDSAATMAVAAGSATALTHGIATKEDVEAILKILPDHGSWDESLS